ncbi:MAG: SPOR domain-containing protein [bacterium]
MRMWLLICVGISVAAAACSAEDIYDLISQGRLEQAGDSLAELSSSPMRDGNMLYYAGLIESDGDRAAGLLEAALSSSVGAIHREEVYFLLAQYYLLKEDYSRLSDIVTGYLSTNETGRHYGDMQRLAVVALESAGDSAAAMSQIKRYLRLNTKGDQAQWGEIDRVRLLWRANQVSEARSELRRLSREKTGVAIGAALYQLTLDALHRNRVEDALHYYDLLREGYPAAVGLGAVQEKLVSLPEPKANDDMAADKLTQTYYSVKVGVFSVQKNALSWADEFSKYGYPVDVVPKKLSGADYHLVMVGRFAGYEQASAFKRRAEEDYGENFQVVAR